MTYDLIIIGGGPAGLVAASAAKARGMRTLLLEKNKLGGDCTHYGCIPSKVMLYCAKMIAGTKLLEKCFGISGVEIKGKPEFKFLMKHIRKIIRDVYKYETEDLTVKRNIDIQYDKKGARFIDDHSLAMGDRILKFRNAIICTGTSPRPLEAGAGKGVKYLDNENFWDLDDWPESIAFIGGGIVSAELGQALARLGSKVTIIEQSSSILKQVDEEIREILLQVFKKDGIKIITGAEVNSIGAKGKKAEIHYTQNDRRKKLSAQWVFNASGRIPAITGLGLENAGVDYNEKGIITNEYLQTSVPHIYACGDVTSEYKFTHAASYQAWNIIENIAEGKNKEIEVDGLPWVIFTDPEIAHTGWSEKEAQKKSGKRIKAARSITNTDRYLTDRSPAGLLKIIFDPDNTILGADAIGTMAGEWIHLLALAIKNKIPANSFPDTIFAYPTYSEIVKKTIKDFLKKQKKTEPPGEVTEPAWLNEEASFWH